uniref:Uncharacterized protein n=1 Tax=Meleagris gallopavo TaxID=9103 RepID=A0A803XWT9_MELGA
MVYRIAFHSPKSEKLEHPCLIGRLLQSHKIRVILLFCQISLDEMFTYLDMCWLFVSGITWVLVYRTDKYKRLKAEVEKQSKKLEKKKETITESAGRQQKKKIGKVRRGVQRLRNMEEVPFPLLKQYWSWFLAWQLAREP